VSLPTIYDVAREAGVSIGTVSYVINGTKRVRPETVHKVEAAMRGLSYRPHAAAKALAMGRTDVIALLYPIHLHDFQMFLSTFTLAIGAVLAETDYRLEVLPLLRGSSALQELEASINSRSMDGALLVHTQLHDPRVALLQKAGIPFVMIGRCADNRGLYFVDTDIEAAVRLSLEHLMQLGHRRVALVGAEKESRYSTTIAHRLQTDYIRALEEYGLPTSSELFVDGGLLSHMVDHVKALLLSEHPPTALAAANEAAVMCSYKAAADLGLRIPQDVAIIGYADSPLYPLLPIPCTTVFDHVADLGRVAAQMLLVRLEGGEPDPPHVLLPPRLVVRASTVAPFEEDPAHVHARLSARP
jgi:DNA-binding LacI/PurR family transcriptional regulator